MQYQRDRRCRGCGGWRGNRLQSHSIPDANDIAAGTSDDCNANGAPDECEWDCNGNDVVDECDIAHGTSADCNLNNQLDECEPDCNTNGFPDDCDIASGTSFDDNFPFGIPDECGDLLPPCLIGDVNCDGASSNAGDLGIVQSPLNWSMIVSEAANSRADVNRDGWINAGDFGVMLSPLNWSMSSGPCDSPNCP